jgi:hypothetical protein
VISTSPIATQGDGIDNILMLSLTAQIIKHHTGVGPIGTGNSQCLAGKVGKGKIVVFGDSNGFTSMLFDKDKPEDSTGFNDTFFDWKQMNLNVLHWLSN